MTGGVEHSDIPGHVISDSVCFCLGSVCFYAVTDDSATLCDESSVRYQSDQAVQTPVLASRLCICFQLSQLKKERMADDR